MGITMNKWMWWGVAAAGVAWLMLRKKSAEGAKDSGIVAGLVGAIKPAGADVAAENGYTANPAPAVVSESMTFSAAFAAARAAGLKTFAWHGSSYTTKMAGE